MAIEKETRISRIDVLPDGQMRVHEATVYVEDGKELSRTTKQRMVDPADGEATNEPERVKSIAQKRWTPAVVAARQEARERERPTRTETLTPPTGPGKP